MARMELGDEDSMCDLKWQWNNYEFRWQDTASEDWES
jgi:hypothetical protein